MELKKSTVKKIIATIEDGDVNEAASTLELLKAQYPFGSTDEGRLIHKAHEEVTIGSPEKSVHHLESLLDFATW